MLRMPLPAAPSPEFQALSSAIDGLLARFPHVDTDHSAADRTIDDRTFVGDTAPRTHDELGEDLRLTRALINRLELVFARIADRFSATTHPELDDSPSMWIRHECRMTSHAAITALQVGEFEAQLPATLDAFLEGRIGFAHLGLMAQTAEFAATRPEPQPFDERALLPSAERDNVARFRTNCLHAEHAMHAASCVAAQADDVDWRRLRLRPGENGTLSLSGFLDAEGGMLLRTALEPLARRSGPDEYRNRDQRLADALVELVAHRLDTGAVPARASQRSHLQVTCSLETLQGLRGAAAGELEGGAAIPDATVQRLACDATISRVILDAESAVIDVGRAQRVVPGSTRRALNVRDKGCRWPGCDRSASWTQAHHIVHWASGHGPTNVQNLVLLCHRHHWMVHEVGFQILRTDKDEVLTVPPHPDFQYRARPPTAHAA